MFRVIFLLVRLLLIVHSNQLHHRMTSNSSRCDSLSPAVFRCISLFQLLWLGITWCFILMVTPSTVIWLCDHCSFWNLPQYWTSLIVLQCYMFHIRLVLLCSSELVDFDNLNVQRTSRIFPSMQNWLASSHCSNICSQTREEQILCTK